MANERHTAAFVVGMAVGGLIGAGYVLFKTPRSGREVRDQILGRIRGVVDTVAETAEVVGVETRRAGEQVAGRIESARDVVTDRLTGLPGIPGHHDVPDAATPDAPLRAPAAAVPAADAPEAAAELGDLAAAEAAAAIDPLEAVEPLAQGVSVSTGPNGAAPSSSASEPTVDEVSTGSRAAPSERLEPNDPGG